MEDMLYRWLYIIIAAVICFSTWAFFTKESNNDWGGDWGRIPMLIRLPLLIVSVALAAIAFFVVFSIQRLIPDLIEFIINIFVIIVCFFAGWNMESVGNVVETISGIIGDIIVSPIVLGCIFLVGFFPNFPRDKIRTFIYGTIATCEISGLMVYGFFNTQDQLASLDIVIFTIETVGGAIFVINGLYKENFN